VHRSQSADPTLESLTPGASAGHRRLAAFAIANDRPQRASGVFGPARREKTLAFGATLGIFRAPLA
jgi:hypothetical protein